MEYYKKETADYFNPMEDLNCDIVCIHVKITNVSDEIAVMIKEVSDDSWINKLGAIHQLVYNATSRRTIDDISNKIKKMDKTPLSVSVGEYLISFSAQNALVEVCGHKKLPLAELLKEKVSGNPGFDYHTISQHNILIFGEAKFSVSNTPKDLAINQIMKFIGLEKDNAELNSLIPFLDNDVQSKIVSGIKSFLRGIFFDPKKILCQQCT